LRNIDKRIIEIARKYGGVLTASLLCYELGISLEEAKKALDKFVRLGEANVDKGVYDIPTARNYLARTDQQIISLLKTNIHGLSKTELLASLNLGIESLEESLRRLESCGIVIYDAVEGTFRLAGIR